MILWFYWSVESELMMILNSISIIVYKTTKTKRLGECKEKQINGTNM